MDHVRKLVGAQHLGLGSDMDLDGYDDLPPDQLRGLRASYKDSYAAAGTIAACVAIAVIQRVAYGQSVLSRQPVQLWLWFVFLPAAVVFGVSRLGWLRASPWWLLLCGPLAFVFGVVLVMVTYNVLFASRQAG